MSGVRKYVEGHFAKVQDNLAGFSSAKSRKLLIHKLRVAIKKIRAVISVLDHIEKKKTLRKSRKKLALLFREAGDLRSGDVIADLLRRHRIGSELVNLPEDRAEKKIAAFLKNIPAYRKEMDEAEKKIVDRVQKITKKDIGKFLNKQRKKIDGLLKKPEPEELHRHRKQLKRLIYLDGLLDSPLEQHEQYDALQDKIGKWHDKAELAVMIKNTLPGIEAKKRLASLCAVDIKSIEKMKKKIQG
jgi:CHAD domain-containing protein